MDSNKNIQSVIKNIIDKVFSPTKIPEEMKKVIIGKNEMEVICNIIFKDIKLIKKNIINQDVKIDLEIFEGLGLDKDNSIFSNINLCKTNLGSFLLKNILDNPVKDTNILESRQKIIKKLVQDEKYYEKINNSLDIIKKNELDILYLWKVLDEEAKYLIEMVFFQNKFLKMFNKNEWVLKMYNYYIIIFSPIHGILTPILMILAPFIFIKFYFKKEMSISLYFKLLKLAVSGISNIMKFNPNQDTSNWTMSQMASLLMWLVFYIHALYSNIQLAKTTNSITNIIHLKINGMSKLVKEGHNLFEIMGKDIDNYSKFVSYDVKKQFGVLWDDIFTQQPTLFSNKGRILKTYKCLTEKKENLLDILRFIGTSDAYLSIANLYKKGGYCFPEYDNDSIKPYINVADIWYPILKKKVIKNNILIGKENPLNVIITGPNAGGKSTFIKSLSLGIIFAQSLGISTGSKFKFTPFSIINTYLNIPDCKGKESLFEAEMRRSLNHIKKMEITPKEDFSFVIMDEIFSSTNPNEGVSGAYAIADRLSSFKNSICIITSHYSYLTNMEKEGKFKNYKIPISRDRENKIIYNYKLLPGVSNQFIALELLEKKGFDKDIIRKARKVNQELCDNIEKVRPKRKLKKKDTIKEDITIKKDTIKENITIKKDTIKEDITIKKDTIKEDITIKEDTIKEDTIKEDIIKKDIIKKDIKKDTKNIVKDK